MSKGKWTQELLFVRRDENGVIVDISEQTPVGYDHESEEITENTRFRVIGD